MNRLLAVIILSSLSKVADATSYHYEITFNQHLNHSSTQICTDSPTDLVSGNPRHEAFPALANSKGPFTRRIPAQLFENGCITIGQTLNPDSEDWRQQRRSIITAGTDIVIPISRWLWRPETYTAADKIEISFNLPEGANISSPYPGQHMNSITIDQGARFNWSGRLAIGYFTEQQIQTGHDHFRLSMIGGLQGQRPDLIKWIEESAFTATSAFGRYPISGNQVLVIPIGHEKEAIPWGEVQRQGAPAVHFFVDQHRSLSEFRADWTGSHEFSHLLHPYIDGRAGWFYEGIASYFQNISRAQTGLITSQQAWNKLHRGFQRGLNRQRGRTLPNASNYMQMYWGGAAYALIVDVLLRTESDGSKTLASALETLNRCCRDDLKRWRLEELLSALDHHSGSDVFSSMYQKEVKHRVFPDVYSALARLGITAAGNSVDISQDPEFSALRDAITSTSKTPITVSESNSRP